MIIEIEAPDGSIVEFPEGTDDATIEGVMQREFPAQQEPQGATAGGLFQQAISGVNKGVLANALGTPVDVATFLLNKGAEGLGVLTGTGSQPIERPFLGSEQIGDFLSDTGVTAPPSDIPAEQFARRVGEEVGAALPFGVGAVASAARPLMTAAGIGTSAAASGVGAAIAQQEFPGNPTAEAIGQTLGFLPMGVTSATQFVRNRSARNAAEDAVPTNAQLRDQATVKYDEADALGVTARRDDVQNLRTQFDATLDREGVLINAEDLASGFPKLSAVRGQIERFSQGNMTVPQMQTMRRTLKNAAGSTDPTESRLGVMLLRQFDDFTAPIAPPLAEARALYTRARKSEEIDKLSDLAETRTNQFSASGAENAVRTEFRGLERRIIKGQERGFSPEEAAAISQVAQGTRGQNTLRNIGRFAPTSSLNLLGAAATPTGIGMALGAPGIGLAVGAGGSAATLSARALATRAAQRNIELVDILIRNGAPIRQGATLSPAMADVAKALIAAQTANQVAN